MLSNELEVEVLHKKGKLETAKSGKSGEKNSISLSTGKCMEESYFSLYSA